MKNAQLWKRILHEGIDMRLLHMVGWECPGMVESIITATQVIDRTQKFIGDATPFDEFRGDVLSIPFNKFWLEFSNVDRGTLNGILFTNSQPSDAGDWLPILWPVQAIKGMKPTALSPILLEVGADLAVSGCNDTYRSVHPNGESPNDSLVVMFLATMRLLSCKNVGLRPHDNAPVQVARATKKHGPNANGYRYHVLVVRPAGARSDAPAQEIGVMPHHVCRGHTAEYGPQFGKGKLFGKYEGRFYIPPHLKGKTENGIVEKDYEVKR